MEAKLRSTGLDVVATPGHEIVVARRTGTPQRPDELRSIIG
jgi:hypothetical protein